MIATTFADESIARRIATAELGGTFFVSLAVSLLILLANRAILAAPSAASPLNLDTATADELIKEIVEASREESSPSRYIQPAADRGMPAAVACEPYLAPSRDREPIDSLYEVLAYAGKSRRSNPELLRLYDPVAYRIFYTPEGRADQDRLAAAIDTDVWPQHFAEAMVHAAPLPALQWMEKQAASPTPNLEHLRQIWQHWGWWLRTGYEKQYEGDVRRVIALLAKNSAIIADAPTHATLLRLVGEAAAFDSLDFVGAGLQSSDATVRTEAATAIRRIAIAKGIPPERAQQALTMLIDASAKEADPAVLARLAESSESFRLAPSAGQAMLELFNRNNDPAVRRAILFSAAESTWPQRSKLLVRALYASEEGSVVGVALQAIAAHPSPEFIPTTLELLDAVKTPQPNLIDAAGALGDARASPRLVAWLTTESNPSARLKIALALGKIADDRARVALLDLLGREANEVVMQHLVTIAGQIKLAGAEPTLISLAEDQTAPMSVRVGAIWALGNFDTPEVRNALRQMSEHPDKYFSDPLDPKLPAGQYERVEEARMYVLIARLRLAEADVERELKPLYDRGTPTAQMYLLLLLADLKRDDTIIEEGLASPDLPVLYAAVKAAGAAAPQKYHDRLVALHDAPFVMSAGDFATDTLNLRAALDTAIAAGQKDLLKEKP